MLWKVKFFWTDPIFLRSKLWVDAVVWITIQFTFFQTNLEKCSINFICAVKGYWHEWSLTLQIINPCNHLMFCLAQFYLLPFAFCKLRQLKYCWRLYWKKFAPLMSLSILFVSYHNQKKGKENKKWQLLKRFI